MLTPKTWLGWPASIYRPVIVPIDPEDLIPIFFLDESHIAFSSLEIFVNSLFAVSFFNKSLRLSKQLQGK